MFSLHLCKTVFRLEKVLKRKSCLCSEMWNEFGDALKKRCKVWGVWSQQRVASITHGAVADHPIFMMERKNDP